MRRRFLRLWVCVILVAPAVRPQESQPSLGDVARKERERRNQQQGANTQDKKGATTDDIKSFRGSARASQAHFEALKPNAKRPGMDYRDFELAESRPELCQAECGSDARCRSFTFAKPGVQGPKAHCWLKFGIPASVQDECCASAVKVAGFKPLEYGTDRPGNPYRDFDLEDARPEACQDECARDAACKAFTYVRPGYQGAKAKCFLKSAVADSKADVCCVSGVKGAEIVEMSTSSQKGIPPGFKEVSLPSGDMTVFVPIQASESERTTNAVGLLAYVGSPLPAISIQIIEETIAQGSSPDQLFEQTLKEMQAVAGMRVLRSQRKSINGNAGMVMEVQTGLQGLVVRGLDANVISGGTRFVVICVTAEADLPKVESLCRTVVESIRVR